MKMIDPERPCDGSGENGPKDYLKPFGFGE